MLRLAEVPATAAVASALGLRAGEAVVLVERLGLADGRPVVLGRHHFPAARLPGLLPALRAGAGISEALALAGVADYLRQSTRVGARMPAPGEAALLLVGSGQPLLVCENVNVDRAGRVVEFCIALHPTPRVQVVFEPEERA